MRTFALAAIAAILIGTWPAGVFASEYHVDPGATTEAYSSLALLRYYSNSLDFVIQKDPARTQEYLGVVPFAHVPPTITPAITDFAAASISISQALAAIDRLLFQHDDFVRQSRLPEALALSDAIYSEIKRGLGDVDALESAAVFTGDKLGAANAPTQGDVRLTYDGVMEKIDRIRGMFSFLTEVLKNSILQNLIINSYIQNGNMPDLSQPGALNQLAGTANLPGLSTGTLSGLFPAGSTSDGINADSIYDFLGSGGLSELLTSGQLSDLIKNTNPADLFQPTRLTLEITPLSVFAGDSVHFEAALNSDDKPMPGRSVYILFNNVQYFAATTDADGHCSGELVIPFWYTPQISAQAFYQPRNDDVGLFLASFSSSVSINVLFYKVSLQLTITDNTYPGMAASINGILDYGTAPPLGDRPVSLYLDDSLVAEEKATTKVSFQLGLDPQIPLGQHAITLSAPADGRYAPAVATTTLEVKQATPSLSLNTPRVAFVPGNIKLSGRVSSELGPLEAAKIRINSSGALVEVATAADGNFEASPKVGMEFTLLGSRPISVEVSPAEPWNAPLYDSDKVFTVNYVSCSLAAIVLAFLGLYVPKRLRRRFGIQPRSTSGLPETPSPILVTPYPLVRPAPFAVKQQIPAADESGKPRSMIFFWYLQALRFVQRLSGISSRPQQTMREFAGAHSSALGPVSRYFLEITLLAERFFYGSREPLQTDADKSRSLIKALQAQGEHENV